jgi:hypothetical protein
VTPQSELLETVFSIGSGPRIYGKYELDDYDCKRSVAKKISLVVILKGLVAKMN